MGWPQAVACIGVSLACALAILGSVFFIMRYGRDFENKNEE